MADRVPLEEPRPLSQSVIWPLMREYFQRVGIRAWSRGVVPEMVTTNARIAATYVNLAVTFLREWREAGGPDDHPVHILESGAGSGRFAHHFLQQLVGRLRGTDSLRGLQVVYVMTDLPGGNVDRWRTHPRLRRHVVEGRLDFGTLDGANPGPVHLLESGRTLDTGAADTPLVLVANYVFDSLPLDAFAVGPDGVEEYLVAMTATNVGAAGRAPGLDDVQPTWTRHRLPHTRRYEDPDLERLLRTVTAGDSPRSVLVPTAGIQFLRRVRAFTAGPLVVLTADKGYARPTRRPYENGPFMATHGSVSFSVDYSVMAAWVRTNGGLALLPSHDAASITVCAFVLDDERRRWPQFAERYDDVVSSYGPDDFFSVEQTLSHRGGDLPTLAQLLARLRNAAWDPSVFDRVFPDLMIRGITADERGREGLLEAARRVEELYFPIGEPTDVPFELAMVRWRAGDNSGALRLLRWSERLHGESADRSFAAALCHVSNGDGLPALGAATRAVELDPRFALGQELHGWLSGRGPVYDDPTLAWTSSIAVKAVGGPGRAFRRVGPQE